MPVRPDAYLTESSDVIRTVARQCVASILAAAQAIADSFAAGGKLLLCGNGGSAADCQHLAAEFVSRFSKHCERPPLPAIALTTDTSFLTAYANDYGYDGVFERQLRALASRGDVLVAISTSGRSANVIRAVEASGALGVAAIALTGGDGGALGSLARIAIVVPSDDTQHIQEAHLAIEHLLCALVEQQLFGSSPAANGVAHGSEHR